MKVNYKIPKKKKKKKKKKNKKKKKKKKKIQVIDTKLDIYDKI